MRTAECTPKRKTRPVAAGLLFALAAGVLVAAAPASARPPFSTLAQTFGSPHFLVHYTTAPGDAAAVTDADVQAVDQAAEAAWAAEVDGWVFPPPPSDGATGGDGRVDVYLTPLDLDVRDGETSTDTLADRSPGYVKIASNYLTGTDRSGLPVLVAHEFFHLVQFGIASREARFLTEGTAEWASANAAAGLPGVHPPLFLSRPEIPLDCPGSSCGEEVYGHWAFYEYLSELHGRTVVLEIWQRAAALDTDGSPHTLQAIADILAAHGSSLEAAWNGYAARQLDVGAFTNPLLHAAAGRDPPAATLTLDPAAAAAQTVVVDHLATRFLSVGVARCDSRLAGTLHVQVTLPAGSAAVPSVRLQLPGRPPAVTPLTVAGGIATFDSPDWVDCGRALLVLPNASASADAQPFAVQASATEALDRLAPTVRAIPSSGRRGTIVTLRYRVFDNSGRTRERVEVLRRGKLLVSGTTRFSTGEVDGSSLARWSAPSTVSGRLRFCVTSLDAAGNQSARSCAPVVVS